MTSPAPAPGGTNAAATTAPGPPDNARYVLAASVLGSSLAFIDGSVVNVALPAIAANLSTGGTDISADISWIVTAYLVPLGALTLLGGAMGDRFGRRRLFVGGVAMFVVASLVCAVAPSFWMLVAGRALQGIAAAILMPNSLAMLGAAFSGDGRSRAIATWAAAGSLTGVIGPLLGGVLIDTLGWRTIFLLNIPVGIGAVLLALHHVAETRDESTSHKSDWSGSLAATASLALLSWALNAAASAQVSASVTFASLAAAAVLAGIFVVIERVKKQNALVPGAIFATSNFIGLTLLTFLLYAALTGLTIALPFFLISSANYSAAAAGAALLPIPIVIGVGSRLVAAYTRAIETRTLLTVGSLIVAAGVFLYVRATAGDIDYWQLIFAPTLIVAAGMALCVAPLTTAVVDAVDAAHVGAASGLNSATARVGGLVAAALLAFLFVRQGSSEQLLQSFRTAAVIGAATCVAAALSAALLMKPART